MTNFDALTLMSKEEQSAYLRNSSYDVETQFSMQTMWNFNAWLRSEYEGKLF